MSRRHLHLLVLTLAAVGLGLFLYKALVLKFPLIPDTSAETWTIEARVTVEADGGPLRIRLLIPRQDRRLRILDENFISGGFGLTTAARKDGNREAVWSLRDAGGRQILFYQARVATAPGGQPAQEPAAEPDAPDRKQPKSAARKVAARPAALASRRDLGEAELVAARALAGEVRRSSPDPDAMIAVLMQKLASATPDRNSSLLLRRRGGRENRLHAAIDVLAVMNVRARLAHGLRLEGSGRGVPLQHWLQVRHGTRWHDYDAAGQPLRTDRYVAWWFGSASIVRVEGGRTPGMTFSVSRGQFKGMAEAGAADPSGWVNLSLLGLPLETQGVYRVLMVIPLGVLVLVVLRNVVGVKTFGTFMPVLIALAFRQTQLFWGIALFSVIVALGLGVRLYLDRLKLLLVPRLAAVLTVVVLLMAALSIVSHRFGFERGLSVALFPMVILTMTIERMSIVWDERGAREALAQGLGSFAAAALAYLIMSQRALEHLTFIFPELLLVVLAILLLLGRYTGYRLSELFRFRALARKP